VSRFQALWLCFLFLPVCASAKEVRLTRETDAHFIGSIGCQSSSCHGGAGEKRSQYITWSRQDFHTHAYAILLDARSARIAEGVGIAEAQSSARCTVCHSPFQTVEQTRLASTARIDEGVSCESCHGAAGAWLRGHTRTDWTYPMRVTAGMRDLKSLYVRANTCVACHQNVDRDLLKVGHPPLVFELDSQSINQPKHWRDDDPVIGPRSWLTGQAVALRETAWRSRTDPDPAPDMQETSVALAWLLAKVTSTEPTLPRVFEPESSDLKPVQTQADALARYAASWNPSVDSLMSIFQALAATDSEFVVTKQRSVETLFYRARRLVLALDRLTNALNTNRGAPFNIDSELNALREDVRLLDNFDATRFAGHLRAFRAKL
jgi:Cytochrome c554 and c-prime